MGSRVITQELWSGQEADVLERPEFCEVGLRELAVQCVPFLVRELVGVFVAKDVTCYQVSCVDLLYLGVDRISWRLIPKCLSRGVNRLPQ